MKSKQWLNRQKKDPFVIKAQQEGFLSRAAFKLIEIEKNNQLNNFSTNYFNQVKNNTKIKYYND